MVLEGTGELTPARHALRRLRWLYPTIVDWQWLDQVTGMAIWYTFADALMAERFA